MVFPNRKIVEHVRREYPVGTRAVSYTHLNMERDASIYVFHADTEGLNFRRAFKAAEMCIRDSISRTRTESSRRRMYYRVVWIDMVVGIISADECQTLETGAETYRGYTSSDYEGNTR